MVTLSYLCDYVRFCSHFQYFTIVWSANETSGCIASDIQPGVIYPESVSAPRLSSNTVVLKIVISSEETPPPSV